MFRLDSDSFALIEAMDSFNASSAAAKADSALLRFHEIKGLAGSIGAKLDKYLGAERVLAAFEAGSGHRALRPGDEFPSFRRRSPEGGAAGCADPCILCRR